MHLIGLLRCGNLACMQLCPTLGYIIYNIYCHVVLVQDQQTAMVLENLASMVKKEEADVGKKLDKFPHACMHAYFSEVGNTSTPWHACILLQASDEKDESAKEAVEESPRFIFMHVSFVKSCWQWRVHAYVSHMLSLHASSPFMHHACMHSGRMIWMKLQSEKKGMTGVSSKGSTNCTKRTQRCL